MTNSLLDGFWSTYLSFRDWRHLSSPVEMQVHINGTRLSPILLACLCPNSTSTFFLYQYFGQPGQSNLPHPGLAYHHDHVWSLDGAHIFLCSVSLWGITLHSHSSWSMCVGGTGLRPDSRGGCISRAWPIIILNDSAHSNCTVRMSTWLMVTDPSRGLVLLTKSGFLLRL